MHRRDALFAEMVHGAFCWAAGKSGLCCPKSIKHVASDLHSLSQDSLDINLPQNLVASQHG
jgi:hypothetical protein